MAKAKTIVAGLVIGVVAYLVALKLLKPKPMVKVGAGTSGADGSYGNGVGFADANGMEESMDGSSNADGSYGNGIGFADANGLEDVSGADGKDYGNGIGFEDANGVDSVDGSFYTPEGDFYSADGDFYDADGDFYGADGDFYSGADGTYYGAEGTTEKVGQVKAQAVVGKTSAVAKKRKVQKPATLPHIKKSLVWWKKRVETLVKAYTTAVDNPNTPQSDIKKIGDKLSKARKVVADYQKRVDSGK